MFITYIVVTILAAAANIFSATLDFIRYKPVLINMAKVGVSESWITTLGILKTTGALGLLIGIGVPAVGIAAAARPRPVFYRRHHHSLARTRLLVWSWRSCSFSWQSPRWGCEWFQAEETDISTWSGGGMPSAPRAIRSKSRAPATRSTSQGRRKLQRSKKLHRTLGRNW